MAVAETFWRKLIESIRRENCILVLGPQVSFDPNDPDCLPLTVLLARRLAGHEALNAANNLTNRNDLAHVAQLLKQQPQIDHIDLEVEAKDFYDGYQTVTTDFHRNLAALPFTLCINAAPDDLFSNALIKEGKIPEKEFYNFKRPRSFKAYKPDIHRPYVFHLYGHCDDMESLVLTEDDLLEFLVNIIKGSPELPPLIRSQIVSRDKNFLFVGFGFQSWHQRILLHVLKTQNPSYESLAVEAKHFFDHPDFSQTVVFYGYSHKIKFEHFSWLDFASQLRNAYIPLKASTATQPLMPADAPKVFLCYASEDRDQVAQLNAQLQKNGIQPWQDKQDLRAGDNWDRHLVHVINQSVDYMIVIQTPAMEGRTEGFFYKEIATAKNRQSNMSSKFRFILPISLKGDIRLPELAEFHQVRLDEPNGLNQLIDAIQTDWNQRSRKHQVIA